MIAEHWNRTDRRQKRELLPRDYIYFSEIGMPFCDRYCKMKGMPPTNDFEDRTLRIFDAGRVTEFIVLRALTLSGLLKEKQPELEIPATDTMLRVRGRADAIIGGFVDYDHWKDELIKHLKEYGLNIDNELIESKAVGIIDGFKETFGEKNLPEMIIEVKSVNSLAFWAHKNKDADGKFRGYPHNLLQCYGYMVARQIGQGMVLYVSRDDMVMEEVPVFLSNDEMKFCFEADIMTMTKRFASADLPPKEEIIVYNERDRKMELNWRVERSTYLSYIYGWENKDKLEEAYHGDLLDMNRAIRHFDEANELLAVKERDEKQEKKLAGIIKKIEAEDKLTIESHEVMKQLNLTLIDKGADYGIAETKR